MPFVVMLSGVMGCCVVRLEIFEIFANPMKRSHNTMCISQPSTSLHMYLKCLMLQIFKALQFLESCDGGGEGLSLCEAKVRAQHRNRLIRNLEIYMQRARA